MQVRPGRFVRVEEMQPEHSADESCSDGLIDEPHGALPPDEPGSPLEDGPIPADADAEISESQVRIEVPVANQDTTGATAQSDR